MFKRLLVPLDGSRFALRALKYAVELAKRFKAEIVLIQIVKPLSPIIAGPPGIVAPATGGEIAVQSVLEENEKNAARARKYLEEKVRAIKAQRISSSCHVTVGDPALSIMEFARKNRIHLIVMSTRGKSGLKRAILGSVADAVIRESGKPVLAIGPQARGK